MNWTTTNNIYAHKSFLVGEGTIHITITLAKIGTRLEWSYRENDAADTTYGEMNTPARTVAAATRVVTALLPSIVARDI